MPLLRRSRRLAIVVMAWFALWLGATVASPLAGGGAGLQLVCSGTSFKLVQPGQDDNSTPLSAHLGQCPACVQLVAPLPGTVALQLPARPEATAPQAAIAASPADHAAAPPAARGPPSFS